MASSSDIRNLFKAFSEDPSLHAAVRNAKNPAEKHEIIRKAGHTPVTSEELQTELAKALQPKASGAPLAPEDTEFVGHVAHLAAASAIVNV